MRSGCSASAARTANADRSTRSGGRSPVRGTPAPSPPAPWPTASRTTLVSASRNGDRFDTTSGQPVSHAPAPREAITWWEWMLTYVDLKWPTLAPSSRLSVAEALTTVTGAMLAKTDGDPYQRRSSAAVVAGLYANARRRAEGELDQGGWRRSAGWRRTPSTCPSSRTLNEPAPCWTPWPGGWMARRRLRRRSPRNGRCCTTPSNWPSNANSSTRTRSIASGGGHRRSPTPSTPA